MKYKGYRILANVQRTIFFETNELGEAGKEVANIQYQVMDGADELWYSVVDKDNFVLQSFETVKDCKEYIREEL